MSKVDRLKTEIAFHEKMFFASLAGMLALIGWLAANYKTSDTWLVAFAVLGLMGSCGFGIDQYRRIKRLLIDLEDCDD